MYMSEYMYVYNAYNTHVRIYIYIHTHIDENHMYVYIIKKKTGEHSHRVWLLGQVPDTLGNHQ